MKRLLVLVVCGALLVTVAACGGGDSPTEPSSGEPALAGTWEGTMTGARLDDGAEITCQATWRLSVTPDPEVEIGVGSWRVVCSDGTEGGDLLNVIRAFGNFVVVLAFPGEPFQGCGWGGDGSVSSRRLSGDWTSEGEDCAVPMRGRFDLRK